MPDQEKVKSIILDEEMVTSILEDIVASVDVLIYSEDPFLFDFTTKDKEHWIERYALLREELVEFVRENEPVLVSIYSGDYSIKYGSVDRGYIPPELEKAPGDYELDCLSITKLEKK